MVDQGIRVGVRAAVVRNGAILLVEFHDESGLHFNLPGGGLEYGETLYEALRREVREETCAEVTIHELLLAWEYVAGLRDLPDPNVHGLTLQFRCEITPDSEPRLPATPDPNQTAVRWIPLEELHSVRHIPPVSARLIAALGTPSIDNPFIVDPFEAWGI